MTRISLKTSTLVALAAVLALAGLCSSARAALPQLGGAVDLATPAPNAVIDGAATSDAAGSVVADAGDVNGDGIEDVLVGAPYSDPFGRRDAGALHVVFGRADGASLDLARLGGGGFQVDGGARTDHLGFAAAAAGDVNGDGYDDIVVGARDADDNGRTNSGSAYLIFGKPSSGAIDVANLGGSGYRISGAAANEHLGTAVAGGSDVNGDGRPDVIVGAPQADRNARTNSGSAYVVFGHAGGGAIDTAALGGYGYAIDGATAGDQLGSSVALTRDRNGDGRPDVLAGAPYVDALGRTDAGAAYLVPGQAATAPVDLAQSLAAAYEAIGPSDYAWAGMAVGEGGDLDGNGTSDLFVGATGTGYNGRPYSGSLYPILGTAGGGSHDLGALDSAWRIDGAQSYDGFGTSFSSGADLNADGRPDLAVGDQFADTRGRVDNGLTRVFYGGGFGGVIDLANTSAPGFTADGGGNYDRSGAALALASDASGDGHPDLFDGARLSDHLGRGDNGSVYMLYGWGSPRLSYPPGATTALGQPLPQLAPAAVARTGPVSYSISPALPAGLVLDPHTGVISGTPTSMLDDGAVFTLTMTDLSGSVSVQVRLRVAPRPGPCANPRNGTRAADRLVGTSGGDDVAGGAGNDVEIGLAGNDCLKGDDANDMLYGNDGNDELRGGNGNDVQDGGPGDDLMLGLAGNDTLTAGDGADTVQGGFGADKLSGGAGNDELDGEQGNDVLDGGPGNDRLDAGDGNDTITDRSGSNRIWAGRGNDRIDSRNGKRDVVKCDRGRDSVKADRIDVLMGCEHVKRYGKRPKKRHR